MGRLSWQKNRLSGQTIRAQIAGLINNGLLVLRRIQAAIMFVFFIVVIAVTGRSISLAVNPQKMPALIHSR
jgi:hypothetical protein